MACGLGHGSPDPRDRTLGVKSFSGLLYEAPTVLVSTGLRQEEKEKVLRRRLGKAERCLRSRPNLGEGKVPGTNVRKSGVLTFVSRPWHLWVLVGVL